MKKAKGARLGTIVEAICRAPLAQPFADEIMPLPVGPWIEAFEREHYGTIGEETMEQSICIKCKEPVDVVELSKQICKGVSSNCPLLRLLH